jgi:IS1 family transposase
MNWETLYCPNQACHYYGIPGLLVKNGTSHGQKQALCRACRRSVFLSYGTAYFGIEAEPAKFETAIRALAEGNSIHSTARIVQVERDTVSNWFHSAAYQSGLTTIHLWHNLHVTECQLDELWSFVHVKEKNLAHVKHYYQSYGDAWIWVAFATPFRVVLAFVVGSLPQSHANCIDERVKYVTDNHIPFFTSDQLPAYQNALLHVYGKDYQPARNGKRGRYPAKQRRTDPDLLYAQVVKQQENGHVIGIKRKIVFGDAKQIDGKEAASKQSITINTSFVSLHNRTLREHNRRLTRKTTGFSKELLGLEKQLWLSLAYYHLCLPHTSLREALQNPESTRGCGQRSKWRKVTPAMAAGITDHVWTISELLGYRVPASFFNTIDKIKHLFPTLENLHHGN